jgi:hypothetical protein
VSAFDVGQVLYRYEDIKTSTGWDDDYSSVDNWKVTIHLREYPVLRVTRTGGWIRRGWNTERFVGATGRKRFAYPTKEEAWISFLIRKRRRVEHLESQLRYARAAFSRAQAETEARNAKLRAMAEAQALASRP